MGQPRIIEVELDDATIIRRSDHIEQERQAAIRDLLADNLFSPHDCEGPFRILLRVEDNRLAIELKDAEGKGLGTIRLGLARFRRPVRDYFAICESYFRSLSARTAAAIETTDMARRAVHNEGAELLRECLKDRIEMDFDTARRLFTLLCVLHIKA